MNQPGQNEPPAAASAAEPTAGASDHGSPAGERYGAGPARALLGAFHADTGRDPESIGELAEWIIRRYR